MIINMSIETSTVPSLWKCARIVPVPKSNGDYRPISLLCHPAKILERIVLKKWLLPSLTKEFNPQQFAFVPYGFTGTTIALTYLRGWILNKIYKDGGSVRLLTFDFKKAFDKVSHLVLLMSVSQCFGIKNNLLKWLYSYLKNRFQSVSPLLEWKACSSGVPQGSILGPILFSMLIDSLKVASPNSALILYADDASIVHHFTDPDEDCSQLEIDNFVAWAKLNKMFINHSKCQSIIFCSPSSSLKTIKPRLKIDGIPIEEVDEMKLLGVYFSSNLQMSSHSDVVYSKCCTSMTAIRKLKCFGTPADILWQCYIYLVFSHLSYAWPVFCEISLNRFETLEKQALNLCGYHSQPKVKERLHNICLRLMKQVVKENKHPLRDLFITRSRTRSLRHQRLLLPKSNNSFLLKTFIKYYSFS